MRLSLGTTTLVSYRNKIVGADLLIMLSDY